MKIGILGGGQLGRMLALGGYPLGLTFRVFDPAEDACAGQVAEHHRGSYEDVAALDHFTLGLDVVTWEFENIPVDAVRHVAERVQVFPPPSALEVTQDRLNEKLLFAAAGLATAEYHAVDSAAEARNAARELGFPCVMKTRKMGYDGKGQSILRSMADVSFTWTKLGERPCLVEALVEFDREVSLVAVNDISQKSQQYPWTINEHRDGILRVSRPMTSLSENAPNRVATTRVEAMLTHLNYVGVLAVEFFEVKGVLVANEIAPRVHNSGHWTIDGAATSQFENHVRAVAGLPLGTTSASGEVAMVNLIGQVPPIGELLAIRGVHPHLYGKAPRPGRKLGHINVIADSIEEREAVVDQVLRLIGTD